jgi:hypothetical protein
MYSIELKKEWINTIMWRDLLDVIEAYDLNPSHVIFRHNNNSKHMAKNIG